MIRTITNWLRLDAQNYIVEVWYAVLILWFALVIMGILSVASNTLTNQSKTMWMALIVCVPLAGLFAYCVFCLTRVDYHLLEFLFRKRKSTLRINSDSTNQRRQRPA